MAVAALANKMARTAWALVAHGRDYEREWNSTPPKGCAAQAAAAKESTEPIGVEAAKSA